MLIGHIGVGLALKKVKPEINTGILISISLLMDVLIAALILFEIDYLSIHSSYEDIAVTPYLYFQTELQPYIFIGFLFSLFLLIFNTIRNTRYLSLFILCLGIAFFHLSTNWLIHSAQIFSDPEQVQLWLSLGLMMIGILFYYSAHLSLRNKKAVIGAMAFITIISVINRVYGVFIPTQPDVALEILLQSIIICSVIIWIDYAE